MKVLDSKPRDSQLYFTKTALQTCTDSEVEDCPVGKITNQRNGISCLVPPRNQCNPMHNWTNISGDHPCMQATIMPLVHPQNIKSPHPLTLLHCSGQHYECSWPTDRVAVCIWRTGSTCSHQNEFQRHQSGWVWISMHPTEVDADQGWPFAYIWRCASVVM